MSITKPYSEWKPALSADKVFSDVVGLSETQCDSGNLYWLEMRPSEKGRYVIVQKDKKGKISDITPKEYNVRTRVCEYGGGSFLVKNNVVYFSNFSDQRMYLQKIGSKTVQALSPKKNKDGSIGKYTSFALSPDEKTLVFAYEKEYTKKENTNFLACITLNGKVQEPTILANGSDFYADPAISSSNKIAWLQWNHPYMPWDSTELMIANLSNNKLQNTKKVDGGKTKSICMPKFDSQNKLYYVMDEKGKKESDPKNWWNMYCYDKKIEQITKERAEYGEPHWVFGESSYTILADDTLAARRISKAQDELVRINPKTKKITVLDKELSLHWYLDSDDSETIYFIGAGKTTTLSVYSYNLKTKKKRVYKKNISLKYPKANISAAIPIEYKSDGDISHAFYYPPKNPKYKAPKGDLPPLLVFAHGGPTASTGSNFSIIIQYWVSAGYAVVDVNYRGSTGYGRKYRDKLLGTWGVVDANDVANAVRYLIKNKKAHPKKVAIRGGSAGGYMVQRVLTEFPNLFSTGASYFGIGNLITLVEETHKFESRYIDNIVGAKLPKGIKLYKERSPINHLHKLKAPMIIFQGSDDKIVTPHCSREIAQILKKKGIWHEYHEYPGEAHGFRMKKNNVDSLTKEFNFYRSVFKKCV